MRKKLAAFPSSFKAKYVRMIPTSMQFIPFSFKWQLQERLAGDRDEEEENVWFGKWEENQLKDVLRYFLTVLLVIYFVDKRQKCNSEQQGH
jgi:predicted small integral membrane protein